MDKSKLQILAESRLKEHEAMQDRLASTYAPYSNAINEGRKRENLPLLNKHQARAIHQCLDNAIVESVYKNRKINETTDSSNIDFLGIQLPIIAALLPSLALNDLAIVQSLDRRRGSVFYLDAVYGTTKGSITSGDVMMNAKTGHNTTLAGRNYATNTVYDEAVGGSGVSRSGNVGYTPVGAGTVIITDGVETFTDNGSGVLVSSLSGGTNGTIVYATGAYAVTFDSAPSAAVTATYDYNMETATNGVSEVNVNMTQNPVEAEDFKLQTKVELSAAIDYEKAHGGNLESELVKFSAGEIRFEMDHKGIDDIVNVAKGLDATYTPAPNIGTLDLSVGSGQEWVWKKAEFLDFVEKASNSIFKASKRGVCTAIITGNWGARIVKQLEPAFKPINLKAPLTGPHKIGVLGNRTVVHDPFLNDDDVIFIYRGDNFFEAAYAFCPYIPLFTTPTLTRSNLELEKGFMSAAGYKVLNAKMMTAGKVTGLPA